MKLPRRYVIPLLTIWAAISLFGGLASITAFLYQYRVAPRTVVAGQSVSNLSRHEALGLINQKRVELSQAALTVQHQDDTVTLPLTELGVTVAEPTDNVVSPANNS